MGLLKQSDFDRIQCLLLKINFNKDFYIPTGGELINLMLRDKKTNQNQLNLILIKAIGQVQKYALNPSQMVCP
jgi:3-dehydroquinate synthetase